MVGERAGRPRSASPGFSKMTIISNFNNFNSHADSYMSFSRISLEDRLQQEKGMRGQILEKSPCHVCSYVKFTFCAYFKHLQQEIFEMTNE